MDRGDAGPDHRPDRPRGPPLVVASGALAGEDLRRDLAARIADALARQICYYFPAPVTRCRDFVVHAALCSIAHELGCPHLEEDGG